MLRSQLRILLVFSSHIHFCHIQDIAKNSASSIFATPSGPYGYLAKLRLDGSFPSVIFRCSCTCHYVSFAAMCHTHEHLQRHSGNDGVLRHPRLPKQNNFPLENYFVSSISPRLFCLRQCYCIAINKIKRRLSFDSLRYARRQVSSLYGFDDGGLFIASLIA